MMADRSSDAGIGSLSENLRPSPALLELIRSNASEKEKLQETFSRQEIIMHLRMYITKHQLYDVRDPRLNYCDDLLFRVFGLKQFTVQEVLPLVAASTTRVKTPTRGVQYDIVDGESPVIHSKKKVQCHESRKAKKRKRSEIESDHKSPSKRRRNSSSFSTVILTSDDDGRWSVDVALHSDLESCLVWSSDEEGGSLVIECYDDSSERLSVQSKETVLIQDLEEEDVWISEDEEVIDISINPFSVEYEIVSDSDSGTDLHDQDTSSEPEPEPEGGEPGMAAMFVVCGESDVEFFADYSDSEDDCSDREIPQEDKWSCDCGQMNTPLSRHCQKCWAIRPGWVQGGRRRHLPAKYKIDPNYLSDMDDDSPIPLQEAIIASLTTSEPVRDTESSSRTSDVVDGTPEPMEFVSSQTSGYFSQNSIQSSTPTLRPDQRQGPLGLSRTALLNAASQKPTLSRSKSCEHSQPVSPILKVGALQRSLSQDKPSTSSWPGLGKKQFDFLNTVKPSDSSLDKTTDSESRIVSASSELSNHAKQLEEKSTELTTKTAEGEVPSQENSSLCIMCLTRPKNASLIHGKTGHQATCYKCAKKLRRHGKPCPVCRKSIQRVIRNFIV